MDNPWALGQFTVVVLPFTAVQPEMILVPSVYPFGFAVQVPLPSEVKSGDLIILISSPSARKLALK